MNKISRYIPSLIISVLLVFFLLGTTAVTTADINITGKYCVRLAEANQIHSKIMTGLENNYKEKSDSMLFQAAENTALFRKKILHLRKA